MKRKIIGGIVLGIGLLSLVIALSLRAAGGNAVVKTANPGTGAQVAVIDIQGMILSGGATPGILGDTNAGSDTITARIREAAKDPDLKAVVLRLNTPGGTASGAQEISVEVDKLRKAGKKVVASMGDVAASGGYWIAAHSDKIVANPGTMTGSIGVIMETANLQGLYNKLGVSTNVFKSGPHKDMGSANRPVTPEEKAIFQGMVDDIYDQFVATVARGRKMDEGQVRKLADGRVFTGQQAKKLGLVDEMGNLYDAIRIAGEMAGVGPNPSVTVLGPRGFLEKYLGGIAGNKTDIVRYLSRDELFSAVWLVCPLALPVGVQVPDANGIRAESNY